MRAIFNTLSAIPIMLASGCASTSATVQPTSIDPIKYQPYSCLQMEQRLDEVVVRAKNVAMIQDATAGTDALALAVGPFTLWGPMLFAVTRGGTSHAELSLLRGEVVALETAAKQKGCSELVATFERQRAASAKLSD